MNLTKSRSGAFRYAGERFISKKSGKMRWTRDVRWDDKVPGLGVMGEPLLKNAGRQQGVWRRVS